MVSMLDVASHVISVAALNYRQMNVAGFQSDFSVKTCGSWFANLCLRPVVSNPVHTLELLGQL